MEVRSRKEVTETSSSWQPSYYKWIVFIKLQKKWLFVLLTVASFYCAHRSWVYCITGPTGHSDAVEKAKIQLLSGPSRKVFETRHFPADAMTGNSYSHLCKRSSFLEEDLDVLAVFIYEHSPLPTTETSGTPYGKGVKPSSNKALLVGGSRFSLKCQGKALMLFKEIQVPLPRKQRHAMQINAESLPSAQHFWLSCMMSIQRK